MSSCTCNSSPGRSDTKRGIGAIYINIGYRTQPLYKKEAFPFRNPEGTEKEVSKETQHQDAL